MTFRDREKARYADIKPSLFSEAAQSWGTYNGLPRPFCLANSHARENLYGSIREEGLRYFRERGIPWHDGLEHRCVPSNHLCCSQSCCVNFLFPLVARPHILAQVFRHIYPDLEEPLPVTADRPLPDGTSPFVAFEWIGSRDYLGEHEGRRGSRTRGANYTSADFVFRFRQRDGRVHIILGEWKYTEEAGSTDYGAPKSPTDRKPDVRKRTYRHAFRRKDGVFKNQDQALYDSLFVGPFYQFMRLQLLAQEMEVGREMDADVVTVLVVCPEANREFRRVRFASPLLQCISSEQDTFGIWRALVPTDKFRPIATETLSRILALESVSEDPSWVDYLRLRYAWDDLGARESGDI